MSSPGLIFFVTLAACADSPGGANLEIAARCAPIDSLSLPSTQIGQTSNAFIQISNRGSAVERDLRFKLDGPNADEFEVGNACQSELAPADFCLMEVRLTPTSAGDKQAVVHFGARTLPVGGTAVAQSSGLFASLANLDVVLGPGGPTSFYVSNQGSSPITLAQPPRLVTDGLVLHLAYACPSSTLTPGAACTVQIGFAQVERGCVAGTAHLESSGGTVDLPVTSEFIATPEVAVRASFGNGHGRVTSEPAGIDCTGEGSRCSARIDSDSVTYTALPDPGHHFNGWDLDACGLSPQCQRPLGPLAGTRTTSASFAPPGAKSIEIAFAGDGFGMVRVGSTTCRSTCTVYVEPGADTPMLQALPISPFGAWSGACTGTTPSCSLGLAINDRQVTVTFPRNPHELGTSILQPSASLAAYMAGGDLITLRDPNNPQGTLISRITPARATAWSRYVAGVPIDLAVTAGGTIYALTQGPILHKVSAAGDRQWSVDLGTGFAGAAAALGEDVVVATESALQARAAADGAVRWSVTTEALASDIAIGPGGIIALAVGAEIRRYTAAGEPLLPTWTAPGPVGPWQLAYDAAGHLAVLSDAGSDLFPQVAKLSRFAPTGALDFSVDLDAAQGTGGGKLVVVGDKIATLRMHRFTRGSPVGAFLEVYDGTGARLWQIDKYGAITGPGLAMTGLLSGALAAAPDGTLTLLGNYTVLFSGASLFERFAP